MPWQHPVLELQTGEGETVHQHRVKFPSFRPQLFLSENSGQLAVIHPQPRWSLSSSSLSTDRHACCPLVLSWKAEVGNRQSCLIARRQASVSEFLLFPVVAGTHQNPARGFGDLPWSTRWSDPVGPSDPEADCRCRVGARQREDRNFALGSNTQSGQGQKATGRYLGAHLWGLLLDASHMGARVP